ncbi:MAG TPA: sigma-70 family RNA polymerase sigma factor [Puia sp.]|jgi:RNA polymerase sigma-70 factor (ECF subfamily)|uniref:sigma-70 family RNA polymerase sigma factor n=1 Tax=Puia sp. TaxID=2045100 RepID=UPI002C654FB0|nr:sigma-70 family RNA polymerase sigma factor [Puia sp.]HVU94068.1 sigma-70 family RNA polymerase sigma factor [Puia sp.]
MKKKLFQSAAVAPDPRQWVGRYADYLYSYAVSRLEDEEQARDLVQETFLAALEKLADFRGASSERTWLTAILKYKIIEVYRKRNSGLLMQRVDQGPELEFFEADNGHWKEEFAPRPFGAEMADPTLRRELAAILQRCIQRLPALWRSIFSLKHLDDVATEDICRDLKVSPANFWVIIHRAKLNLRACLQKEGL